jgi:DNA-binding NarL/FixJ family response regulator
MTAAGWGRELPPIPRGWRPSPSMGNPPEGLCTGLRTSGRGREGRPATRGDTLALGGSYPVGGMSPSTGPEPAPADVDPRIRVLIVEDHQMVAEGLVELLRGEPDIRVVGICTRLDQFRERLRNDPIDLVLLDCSMPDGDGLAAARFVRQEHPRTRVIVVSAAEERSVLLEALEAGCQGFIGKSESMAHLPGAIRGAMLGTVALSPAMAARLTAGSAGPRPGHGLSHRELDVLELFAQGKSSEEIASELFMSDSTLRNKIARINSKLGVHSRLDAVTMALRLGLIDVRPEDGPEKPQLVAMPRHPG